MRVLTLWLVPLAVSLSAQPVHPQRYPGELEVVPIQIVGERPFCPDFIAAQGCGNPGQTDGLPPEFPAAGV